MSTESRVPALLGLAKKYGQEHIFKFWDELNSSQQDTLEKCLKDFDFQSIPRLFKTPSKIPRNLEDRLKPPERDICGSLAELRLKNSALLEKYVQTGLKAVHEGKVAVLLLAGGQGTRLGVKYPKGLYCPDLPSGRSLYQIQAEHLHRVATLAMQKFGSLPTIPWYIMTSERTEEVTLAYFKSHNYFGHDSKNVIFFEQFALPAFDSNGKILLEKKHKISMAPDGNGGLYRALRERHIIEDMASRGVEYVQVYGVDNILVKLPDLPFIGFSIDRAVECADQVVEKVDPAEPIGVVGMVDGRYQVVEYSEISPETAALRNDGTLQDGAVNHMPANGNVHKHSERLTYSHGNICVHFFTRKFLERVTQPEIESSLKYHVAKKKIPHVDLTTGQVVTPTEPNGVKFEKFVFDVFPFAEHFGLWEVPRNEQFSPLKNGPNEKKDCPLTSRHDYLAYHRRLAEAAGARFVDAENGGIEQHANGCTNGDSGNSSETVIEISPLITYSGENLECLKDKVLKGVNLLELAEDTREPKLLRVNPIH
ncbi:unnamed protein product [Calicophoron daubneyi]|uniref:UDP-N-acetylglucosamine diphosphorylase n=1 Tax=Calicophoron daubneyi TaxID=300641 RepID=A0AAV2TW58_CALDB